MKKIVPCFLSVILLTCTQAQVIATVGAKKITLKYLQHELTKLPDGLRKNYESDLPGFLEELIVKEALLTKALRFKIDTVTAVKERIKADKTKRDNYLIDELFSRVVFADISVADEEAMKFYKDNQSQMNNLTFDQMKPQIADYLIQQKRQSAVESYIANLVQAAKITRNEKWRQVEEKKVNNPITAALKNSLPTMVDFGSTTCLPCIQMKPIMEELRSELTGKANIIFINVNEQPVLTRQYKITLIPLQVFFDKSGTEIYRHIGFFPKDSIMLNLNKAGLE
jgi:thioredoxin 1